MAGVDSRRRCDRLIAEGRVQVNGEPVVRAGFEVDPAADDVRVDGRVIAPTSSVIDLILNKPRGMLVTLRDPRGRPTVASILREMPGRVFPVGRLDQDSEGLLLLTNDGDLAYRVAHPKFGLPKTYHVEVRGTFTEANAERLRAGVFLREGLARPRAVRALRRGPYRSEVEIVLTEGWKREIRRMLARLGFQIDSLVRVGLGNLRLGGLQPGQWRLLNPSERRELRATVGLTRRHTGEDSG